MGAEKEIVNAAALAKGVEILGAGLTSFESSTRQMKGICEDFEGRLGKLEREMLPMKEISAKLSTSRRNIISAIEKMESINECFLLEKELRGVVQKGMRGNVGAVEYLEEMRRIDDAIAYFRKWPSLKSQKEAIKGLEELSSMAAKECIDEFNRLMRTVGPAVQFQTQTNTFESVNTLSDNVAQSLAAIGECLTLLRHSGQLRQNYTAARRVAVKTALDKWESKFEITPKGQQARGGGPWLRFYVDFSTKLVTAERLLWERALKASDSSSSKGGGDAGKDGRGAGSRSLEEAEAAFVMVVNPVIEKLVREVDRKLQSSLAEVRDRSGKKEGAAGAGGAGAASSGGGGGGGASSQIRARTRPVSSTQAAVKDGDIPADIVVALMEMSDALHKGSYSLQDILKVGGDDSGSKGDDRGYQSRRGSVVYASPDSAARRGRANKATDALAAVQRRLSRACLQTFADLAEAVSTDPKLRRHVPDNGAVHPLSSNVLRGIKRVMRFRRGYEELVQGAQMPWDPESAPGDRTSRGSKNSPVRERGATSASNACPRFTTLVNHLIKTLFVNLTEKSGSYPTATLPGAALRELFLLNNAEYVLANAKMPFSGLALNSPGTAPSPSPAEEFRSIFGEAPSVSAADGARSPRGGGVKPRSPRKWGFGGFKSKDAVKRAAAARSLAEGLVGPDAGDDELQGLSIADFMTESMSSLLKRLVQEKKTGYMDTLMMPLTEAAKDDIGELKYQRGKLLTLDCGRLLKAKFTAFNESWEEVYHSQLPVSVVDPSRRVKLKEEAKARCLVPYRELYCKYQDVQFSKKHQEQYLKYSPDAIDQGIGQLFSG
ncbi:unnamed protein product [Ectocarpus sp. 6 AP-2014]